MLHSSTMQTDPLSDVLDLVDARCILSGILVAGGNWARRFKRSEAIKFLAVVKGQCWMSCGESPTLAKRFKTGDVIITNSAPGVILATEPEMLVSAECTPLDRDGEGQLRAGEGEDFMMIGGLLQVDEQRSGFLRESLPPVVHISEQSDEASKLCWLLTELAAEMQRDRAGSATASSQLAKLLFIEALRLHIESTDTERAGWLSALDDRHITLALKAIHLEPSHPWTLKELAKLSGMSRTSFAVRFREVVGIPPLTYVLNWRMRLAEKELSETDRSVAEIADFVGYGSESAFSNAFRRSTGRSPGIFRKEAIKLYAKRRHKVEHQNIEVD